MRQSWLCLAQGFMHKVPPHAVVSKPTIELRQTMSDSVLRRHKLPHSPSTSFQTWTSGTPSAAPISVAVRSLPPRPNVVIAPAGCSSACRLNSCAACDHCKEQPGSKHALRCQNRLDKKYKRTCEVTSAQEPRDDGHRWL